jgi:RNA polymerase sigma-70 factor (ECF subfamily)
MRSETGFATTLDAATLVRAQRGDRGAREQIYRTYERPAFGLALRVLGRAPAAEDAVHDSFVRAFEKLGSYRGEAPFGAWLKRLVVNASIDRLRSEQRWVDADEPLDELLAPDASQGDQVEALGLLARLPARARSVVWLHEMEGYSHVEIGALFKQSESWSKSLLARSLERLRSALAQESEA